MTTDEKPDPEAGQPDGGTSREVLLGEKTLYEARYEWMLYHRRWTWDFATLPPATRATLIAAGVAGAGGLIVLIFGAIYSHI